MVRENLPEKLDENKNVQKDYTSFQMNFRVIPETGEVERRYKNPNRCPLEFFYHKNEKSGKNVLSAYIINSDSQTPEMVSKVITEITGIVDVGLANKVCHLAAEAIPGNIEEAMSLILQAFNNSKPKNALEAGLIAQATALEAQGMTYLRRAENADMLCHREASINLAIKLLRLQHETLETLNRLRRGNEQKVVVQHQYVQVNEGGKAVVGLFDQGGGVNQKSEVGHGV